MPIAVDAVRQQEVREQPAINNLLLVAPDIRLDTFEQIASDLSTRVRRVTVYSLADDTALKAAESARKYQRLGDVNAPARTWPNVDTVVFKRHGVFRWLDYLLNEVGVRRFDPRVRIMDDMIPAMRNYEASKRQLRRSGDVWLVE